MTKVLRLEYCCKLPHLHGIESCRSWKLFVQIENGRHCDQRRHDGVLDFRVLYYMEASLLPNLLANPKVQNCVCQRFCLALLLLHLQEEVGASVVGYCCQSENTNFLSNCIPDDYPSSEFQINDQSAVSVHATWWRCSKANGVLNLLANIFWRYFSNLIPDCRLAATTTLDDRKRVDCGLACDACDHSNLLLVVCARLRCPRIAVCQERIFIRLHLDSFPVNRILSSNDCLNQWRICKRLHMLQCLWTNANSRAQVLAAQQTTSPNVSSQSPTGVAHVPRKWLAILERVESVSHLLGGEWTKLVDDEEINWNVHDVIEILTLELTIANVDVSQHKLEIILPACCDRCNTTTTAAVAGLISKYIVCLAFVIEYSKSLTSNRSRRIINKFVFVFICRLVIEL